MAVVPCNAAASALRSAVGNQAAAPRIAVGKAAAAAAALRIAVGAAVETNAEQ